MLGRTLIGCDEQNPEAFGASACSFSCEVGHVSESHVSMSFMSACVAKGSSRLGWHDMVG